MAKSDVKKRKKIDKILNSLGAVAAIALLAIGGMAWWASSFTTTNVKNELTAQKVYFPPAGSAAITSLPAVDQTEMNKYAGQQLLDGKQAKVYANNFIAVHLSEVAGGKTYAEVSAEAQKDPSNAKLQAQANTLFKGETLRGLLLGDAYAFWTVGNIAKYVAYICFAAGALMTVLVLMGLGHLAIISRK